MARRFAGTTAALLLLVAAATFSLTSSAQDGASKISKIFDRIEENKGSVLWDDIRALNDVGKEGIPEIRQGLTRADANVRVAAGAVLYKAEFVNEGIDVLAKLLDHKTENVRRVAARTTALLLESDTKSNGKTKKEFSDRLKKLAAENEDDYVKVFLYRAAYTLTETIDSRRAIRDLFEKSVRVEVKDEAALALAQMEVFQITKGHLQEMVERGGENGRLARTYLKINDMARRLEKTPTAGGQYKLLDEIIDKLKTHYYDTDKIKEDKLIEAAARGILNSLDPYTAYYDEKMIDELRKEGLEGHYGGIGARVAMRKDKNGNSWLTITEPIFSGPAYRVGLRSHDMIVDIDGLSTANLELGDLVKRLRGKPNTPVTIKVLRRGWMKEKEFKITREEVQLETTLSQMLPGQIGYINYTTFGDLDDELKNKGTNIETQVKDLNEAGMKALVLDLRGNAGGYLRTARRIASMFLEKDAVIVTTKAQGKELDRHISDGTLSVKVPVIVLVDDGSASASEILAGALQDHKRALVVGQRTFGKGSVQDLKGLEVTGEKTAARITIAKWYLPSGNTVEKDEKKEGGVEPDIKIALSERDFWKEAEFEKLRVEGKVQDYITKQFEDKEKTKILEQLAETDSNDFTKYPGYDELFASVTTRLTKEEMRELVRDFVRKKVQDDRKRAFTLDFQTDTQLQRGIFEACKKASVDFSKVKEYSGITVPQAKDTKEGLVK